jgi:alkanesulfonate monooxygenase SsuD/methylene tetrahydromethanopterin reductase-like flavin-dependent oxidoreductase (luciferase family)
MEALHDLVEIYRQAFREAGHDLATQQILGKFHIYVSESLEQGLREASPYMKNYSAIHAAVDPNRKLTHRDIGVDMERGFIIVGDPQRCIETIRRWRGSRSHDFFFYFPFRRYASGDCAQEHPSVCRARYACVGRGLNGTSLSAQIHFGTSLFTPINGSRKSLLL